MKTIVFYHANCADGAAAAWAVFKANPQHPDITFVPCNYTDSEWQKHPIDNAVVIFVDFSEPKDSMLEICKRAHSVAIYDHHKTAQAALSDTSWHPSNLIVVFDMNRSGAQIAWDVFNPGKPRPKLIDYVADRDLWQFKLPLSKDVSAYIWLYKTNIAEFDVCAQKLEDDLAACALEGKTVSNTQGRYSLGNAEKLSVRKDADGNIYGFGNVTNNISETGDVFLTVLHPEAAYSLTYFDIPEEGKRVFSLRSRKGFDVSVLAKKFGGGGHAAAAGFTQRHAFVFPTEA